MQMTMLNIILMMGGQTDGKGGGFGFGLLLPLIIAIGLIFLLREVGCWYWKINKRIELMQTQINLLNNINNKLSGNATVNNETPVNPTNQDNQALQYLCSKCGKKHNGSGSFCTGCGAKL